eukprot:7572105-Pyramimonas_sp.AAC.1
MPKPRGNRAHDSRAFRKASAGAHAAWRRYEEAARAPAPQQRRSAATVLATSEVQEIEERNERRIRELEERRHKNGGNGRAGGSAAGVGARDAAADDGPPAREPA